MKSDDRRRSFDLNSAQETKTAECPDCEGRGTQICNHCGGAGGHKYRCSMCDGTGDRVCTRCDGELEVECIECTECTEDPDTGKTVCENCDGFGWLQPEES